MARSRSIGNVYAELSVKDKMTSQLNRVEKNIKKFAASAVSIGANVAMAMPAAAFAGITISMKSAIDAGGKLNDMMARTGADGEQLFILQRAFENAGVAGDKVPGVLNKMQKALAGVNEEGERVQNRVFADLGLSVEQLRNMDAARAFRTISEAISAIPEPAKRSALAMEIFGRSGGELLAIMNDGEAFKLAAEQVGGLGKTLSENASRLDAVGDAFGSLGTKAQQIGAEIAVEMLPVLEGVAEALTKMDLGKHTKDAIDFAHAMAGAAESTAKFGLSMPQGQKYGIFGKAAGMGIENIGKVLGFIKGEKRLAPTLDEPWSKDEASPWNMLPPEWTKRDSTSKIPNLLKRPDTLVQGMTLGESGIPGIADMIGAIVASVSPREKETKREIADFSETQYDVNDMQRRGLGMGGETVAKTARTQVTLLTEIRDVLKRAQNEDHSLLWP